MKNEPETFDEAVANLKREIERLLLPLVRSLDNLLRRFPRLYGWLSR